MKQLTAFILAALLSTTALAGKGNHEQRMQEHLDQMATELNLSDEQRTQVESILQNSFEKRRAVLESHGIEKGSGRPDKETREAVKDEMMAIREATDQELAEALSTEQLESFKAMQAEHRDKMRERFKDNRRADKQSEE